jgi:hypothetical protein
MVPSEIVLHPPPPVFSTPTLSVKKRSKEELPYKRRTSSK